MNITYSGGENNTGYQAQYVSVPGNKIRNDILKRCKLV